MTSRLSTIDRQRGGPPDFRHVQQPKRALSREEAAWYVGIGVTMFTELVHEGKMPQPVRVRTRLLWDIRALDLAFDKLSGNVEAGNENEWDRL